MNPPMKMSHKVSGLLLVTGTLAVSLAFLSGAPPSAPPARPKVATAHLQLPTVLTVDLQKPQRQYYNAIREVGRASAGKACREMGLLTRDECRCVGQAVVDSTSDADLDAVWREEPDAVEGLQQKSREATACVR
jgi:hypothetical protein